MNLLLSSLWFLHHNSTRILIDVPISELHHRFSISDHIAQMVTRSWSNFDVRSLVKSLHFGGRVIG